MSSAEQAIRLESFLRADRQRGFELTQAPLMRMTLLRLGDSDWQLVWSFHHILLDGWCTSLLLQEVFHFYEGYQQGQVVELPRPRSYHDYIGWLQQQDLNAAESYWRNRLAGFTRPVGLELEPPSGERPEGGYGQSERFLTETSTKALETLAREQQVTLNTVVQGAWAVLLSRYSGERDVVYGVTVSGRPAELAGVEQMVGLFINTLPLRVQVESGAELGPWLQRLQAEQAEMRQYEYSPLVEVQGWSEVERGVGLFETLLAFENYPVAPLGSNGTKAAGRSLNVMQGRSMERTNYPVTIMVGPGERLQLRVLYQEQCYDAETIERVLGHLEQILVSMAGGAQQRVGELRMLSAEEEQQIVEEWNETEREYAREACIHELFAEQARRRPEAIAVIADGEDVSYGELDQRANQVAHRLQQLGVGPEVVVGICVERSVDLIVGLLGILKAGGAYLPLDAEYPQERLEYMLADAGVSVLLTQNELRERLPVRDGIECLELSDWFASEAGEPESGASAETLAYVIYTSGSTGQPKGVAVPHRGVVRLVQQSNYVKLDEEEVVLQMAPVSFDASTFEIWGALLNGARLVVMAAGPRSLAEIAATVKQHEVSTMWLTAGLFQVMAAEQLESLHEVKQLLAGGDVLNVRAVQAVLDGESGARVLINGYGPTENTTFSCCHVMQVGERVGESVPIGQPITNSTAYVLDARLRPVPVGVRGELYLGGDGLARGYVGRAELTAERFIPNPFRAGERLYQTGDVVRWNAAGVLEFVGRVDQQVKVRGYRVELGEVEEALAGYEGISESAVVVRTEGEGEKRLVGYVVARGGVELEVSELRAYLETKLPAYMIPGVFVELTELPLTANGKVDRKALAAAELGFAGSREYQAPRTAVEELLAGIWAEVLGVERVGIHDNFFELGGHSLLATQVISRVRETFTLELPLRSVFEAPQLSSFAEAVEQGMREEHQVEAPPMESVSRERVLPLSFAQQRLWFLDQLEPMSNAYNIPSVVRLRGPFNPEIFTRAVEEIMRRHESLRTRFVTERGRARQEISVATELSVPVIDLRSFEGTEQDEEVRRLAMIETRKPFDLTTGPLVRLTVLRLAENEHVMMLTMHHIVSDGWSMGVLMRELTVLYDAFSRRELAPLPDLPIQYADYAVWQREWLQGEVLEQQMKYWREQLQGAPPVLELPTDHPRPAVQSFRGAMSYRRLSGELLREIEALGRREGVTLYMSVLAAFTVVLARYSGEREIVVGTPIAGRTRQEIEGLIGFFVNTLVLRTSVDEQETVRQLLARVREVCLGAYTHQDVPFEQLVEELHPERDLSRQPLFQVMYELEGGGDEHGWQIGDLQVEVEPVESDVAKFDLTLRVKQGQAGWELGIEYKKDLYEEATIARMLEHVERVLQGMVADVKQQVRKIELLSGAEQEQLLEQWNATDREYKDEICVQQLFEARAAERPEAVALVCEGEQVSYSELNRRSNQLAHYLRELGVGPEVVVGLCMDRTVEMVVGLLGILKAGGAYLPLDPTYPQQRLSFMLDDAAPSILLTKQSLEPSLPFSAARVLCLDADQHLFVNHSDENPHANIHPFNLAYLIYTSGSTGIPKGVQIQHRALVNFLHSMQREPGLTANDYLLAVTSLSFDIAALEIFLPLTCGAQVEVVSREMAAQGVVLKERLIGSQATIMQATPATWRLLVGAGLDGLDRLQRWCGGEALNRELANQLANDQTVVWNLYGPTETTIWSGLWRVKPGSESVLIGKPIANTQFYVLDEHFRPTPVGVPGELYIGGDGVARGYMNRPELTAERFTPNPFGKSKGSRLYRTGDVVKWKAEGELEYVERRDQQVKVRGYRIELGEIEAVLNEHPAVRESVAAVKEDGAGNKRLVAYIVEETGNRVSARELRENVKERLPEYMVPTQLMKIEAMPLTPNGKVDRKKLSSLEGMSLILNEYVAPRSMSEAMLAEIWQRALGVERVGINDNFFELGGDSIISIQIIAISRERGFQFTPKDLFQYQTIATLLEAIGSGAVVEAEQGIVMGPVRLTPPQQWFFEQELSQPEHFNQSLLLEVREQVDAALLEKAAQQLLVQHDALRLRFERSESGWQQYHAEAEEPVSFTTFDLSSGTASEQAAAIEAEAAAVQASLNLSEGPLVRFVYFDLGDNQPARLLLVCHHLIVDGMSWRIILQDLQQSYRALAAGEEVPPLLKSTSYKQWAEEVAAYAESDAVGEQEAAWLQPDREHVQRLPRDYDSRENLVSSAGVVAMSLTEPETEALLQEVPAAYYTQINEVLLSALAVTLKRWTGQRLVSIDMEGHGRDPISERVDVSRTVGWFTTIYPVLLEVPRRDVEVGEVLKQVKEQMRQIPEQGLGYGLLRYQGAESVQQRLRQMPQPEVLFNYSGQFDQTFTGSGMFSIAREKRGMDRSAQNQRQHLLEISGGIVNGRLQLTWVYSQQVHKRETVERLAADFIIALQQLIEQCQWGEVIGFTPSDFPEAELSQQELDELVAELS
nr:condensation domain-containing protein [uncultured bacterium]